MNAQSLIDRARVEIKLADYGVAPASALGDPSIHPRVQDYRRQSSARMMPLDKDDVAKRIPAAGYHVSRKVDGEFTVLVYRQGEALTVNPGGTVRLGMPWQQEAARRLADAGIREALVVGELYVRRPDDSRPRVHDVTSIARQPDSAEDVERLSFAVFDLMSLDGSPSGDVFADTWRTIVKLFDGGERVHPVEAVDAKSADEIMSVFEKWVEKDGAEGLVVRSDTAGQFKIKPRHTLDVAVVGFTESIEERQGLLHDLLVAVMRTDGTFHVLTRVGGGFGEDLRRDMLSDLKDRVVASDYVEVNSDHVAYQMVEPEWVVEVSCLDVISQTTRGGPINRMVLDWERGDVGTYRVVRRLPLASVLSPQFLRRREDKSVRPDDVRIQQIADLVEVPLVDRDARQMTLPKSEILSREVYTKQLKGDTMVRKFVTWKTNKETESEDYPAYVVHYTDFSPNRKVPLAREVRVSDSREQIESLLSSLKESNIKKGWEPHSSSTVAKKTAAAQEEAAVGKPASKKAPKTAPAKKKAPKKAPQETAAKKKASKKAPKKAPAKRAPKKKAESEGG